MRPSARPVPPSRPPGTLARGSTRDAFFFPRESLAASRGARPRLRAHPGGQQLRLAACLSRSAVQISTLRRAVGAARASARGAPSSDAPTDPPPKPTHSRLAGDPADDRRRVQPPQAHPQGVQPRRAPLPRLPGYPHSVQKRRVHHGTGARATPTLPRDFRDRPRTPFFPFSRAKLDATLSRPRARARRAPRRAASHPGGWRFPAAVGAKSARS